MIKSILLLIISYNPILHNRQFMSNSFKPEFNYCNPIKANFISLQSLQGYNSAILAYGQTNSGKTHTILGPEAVITEYIQKPMYRSELQSEYGILPRSFFQIIQSMQSLEQQFELKCSYLEIYNENIYDLLDNQSLKSKENSLKLRESYDGVKLYGLTEQKITKLDDLFNCLSFGIKNRVVSNTQFNLRSSRSHCIFILDLTIIGNSTLNSKLHFVDLAGSERLAKETNQAKTLEETKKINQSLSCLGFCIMALSSKNKKHVPYRDSKLTFLLKECLGGNCSTSFICTVNPNQEYEERTQQTLKFAQRAKKIVNKMKLNVKLTYQQMEKLVEDMKLEIKSLKESLVLQDQIDTDRTCRYRINTQELEDDPTEQLIYSVDQSLKTSLQSTPQQINGIKFKFNSIRKEDKQIETINLDIYEQLKSRFDKCQIQDDKNDEKKRDGCNCTIF